MRTLLAWILVVSGLMTAGAAYLESDLEKPLEEERVAPPPVVRPPIVRPPVRPVPGLAELGTLLSQVRVGNGYHERGWAVFPLEMVQPQRTTPILTLDEALSRDWLTIRETDQAQVASLLVRNEARSSVFMMAGEVLLGGRQNRIVQADVLLPARSGFVSVPVYCGEKERWGGPVTHFNASPGIAQPRLRKEAAARSSQDAVWKSIDRELHSSGVSSSTRDYQRVFSEGTHKTQVDATCRRLLPLLQPRTVGLVLVRDDSIRSCDLFSDPALFAKMRGKILPSYALEMHVKPSHRHYISPPITREDVGRFLNRAIGARATVVGTNGEGRLYRLSGAVTGEVLTWRSRVVHAGLFP